METNYDALIQASADELFQQMSSKEDQGNIDRLRAAFEFAREAHSPQKRKSGEPYIIHPVNVARIVAQELELGADPVIAAFLHDVVEDSDWTFEMLEEEGFTPDVIEALKCLTKVSEDENYDDFIERIKKNPLAVAVKINDLTDNMDIRRLVTITEADVQRLRKYLKAYRELVRGEAPTRYAREI